MPKVYDTVSLRQTANRIFESEEELSDSRRQTLYRMMDDVPNQLEGSTAQALQECVTEINSALALCEKDLDKLGSVLRKYAAALEEADQKASETIRSR